MELKSYAKLNLSLDVVGRRPDGYHDLSMVMQTVTLSDTITISLEGEGQQVSSNLGFLPRDGRNLALKAALQFQQATGCSLEGLRIALSKSIPVCSGMAGGSGNGAAVLHGLNTLTGANLSLEQLAAIGEKVGADVPYCVMGGTVWAQGKGELLTPLPPLPHCYLVLCKPSWSVSTPELFGVIDSTKIRHRPDTKGLMTALEEGNLTGIAQRMYNVFEDVLPPRHRSEVNEIKNTFIGQGALGAVMTGTGSTVFGLFDRQDLAKNAYDQLKDSYPDTYLTEPCSPNSI